MSLLSINFAIVSLALIAAGALLYAAGAYFVRDWMKPAGISLLLAAVLLLLGGLWAKSRQATVVGPSPAATGIRLSPTPPPSPSPTPKPTSDEPKVKQKRPVARASPLLPTLIARPTPTPTPSPPSPSPSPSPSPTPTV